MKAKTRLRLLSKYPAWNEEAFRLTLGEIENPWLVVDAFFDTQTLPDARTLFEEISNEIIASHTEDTASYISFLKDVERAIEVLAVLYQKRGEELVASATKVDLPFPEPVCNSDEREHRVFLFDWAMSAPWENVREVYRYDHPPDLLKMFGDWVENALTNTREFYSEAEERAALLSFSKSFRKLLTAIHASWLVHQYERKSGFELDKANRLQANLLRKEIPDILSDEELKRPKTVIRDYFESYSVEYTRAELWNLFDCMISEEATEKLNLLTAFECFYAIVLAGWALVRDQPTGMTDIPSQDPNHEAGNPKI